MELKNISEKVISIGSTVVMPDHITEITTEQATTPSIKALIKQGYVSVTEKSSATGKESQTGDAPAPTGTPKTADNKSDGDKTDGDKTDGDKTDDDSVSNAENSTGETGDDKAATNKRGKK